MEGVKNSKKIEVLNVKKLKNVNVSRQSIYNFIKLLFCKWVVNDKLLQAVL